MLPSDVKNYAAWGIVTLCGTAALGFTLSLGYRWGAGDLADIKAQLAAQEAKVVTVTKVVQETVYKDRIEYRDRVRIVREKLPVIVDRPVYKNVCLDEDGVDAFNTFIGR